MDDLRLGHDGAQMPHRGKGTVIFDGDGFYVSTWRPPKPVREKMQAGEWPAWVAVLSTLHTSLAEHKSQDG